jgi:ATP-dependent helicase/nuclease subunit B
LLELTPEIHEHLRHAGTLVVPSPQRAAALRLAYGAARLASGSRVWSTPDVLPWSAWLARGLDEARMRDVPVPRRLTRSEEWWLWREALRAACADLPVLRPDGLIDSVRRAVLRLEDYGLTLRSADTAETATLLGSHAHFMRRCQQLEALWVASWRACAPYLKAPASATWLAGFAEIGTARRAWLEQLGVRIHSQSLPADAAQAAPEARLAIRGFEDPQAEAVAAAQWCAERLTQDPRARLLLVVTRLPEQRHHWLRALSQRLDHRQILAQAHAGADAEGAAAIEGGQPLEAYALVALALQLLTLAAGEADFATLSAVLRSPFLSPAGREARLRIDRWLRDQNIEVSSARLRSLPGVGARGLDDAATRTLQGLLQALELHAAAEAMPPERAPAADWAQRFARVLERAGWPGVELSSAEQQLRMRFEELLGELAVMTLERSALRAQQVLGLLRQLAAATAFESASDDVPVTVTAATDDPIVRYDGIWVAGLTADVWPQPQRADPWIPWGLQRSAGMPMADPAGALRLARQALRQWRAATDQLVLSYPRSDSDLPRDPSPLLLEVPGRVIRDEISTTPPFELERWMAAQAPRLEAVADTAGPAWPDGQPLRGGTKLLELQSLCPFRGFAQQRLAAQPLREPAPGIDPMVRGQILHRALELLWRALGNADALRVRAPQLPALVRDCIEQALVEAQRRCAGGLDPQLLRREALRDTRLLERLLEWELARGPFEIEALEQPQSFEIGGATLALRLDRVDRLGDGRLIVFDYKSGAVEPFDALADRPRRPQLPAYAIAAGERTAAVAMLYLGREGLKLRGIADRTGRLAGLRPAKDAEPGWGELLQRWREQLAALVQEFLRGHAIVDPQPKACDTCHLQLLCRIQLAPPTEPPLEPLAEPDSSWSLPP